MMQIQKINRAALIVIAAVAVNALLFTMIEYMVRMGQIRLTETSDINIANFIRVAEQSREVRSRRDPQAPQKPTSEMQEDIQRLAEASSLPGLSTLTVNMPDIDVDVDVGVSGDIQIARELTPLVRIPADYPPSALSRRIEGFVLMRFTVTETGSVADPEVLSAEPPNIFDAAARRAVLRWKFQPQFVDGEPVRVVTYTRLVFKLKDSLEQQEQ